ncbi:MAG: TIGR04104 family putative zinc finger protein [Clostridium paraputrificum]|nr:MAG TPA: hypothetical protein [Caudoviricetes sp.]
MYKCDNCNEKFKYKEIFVKQIFNKNIKCDKCFQEYKIKRGYLDIVVVLIVSPLLISNYLMERIGGYTLLIYLIWCGFVYALMPMFYRYRKVNSKE